MKKKHAIASEGDNLAQLVHEVESGKTIEITRRGRTVAILLSSIEFARLSEGQSNLWADIELFRAEADFDSLAEVFDDTRDFSKGREVDF